MKSNFSRSIRFPSWTSSNWTQKKVTENKVEKNPKRHPENGIFHPMSYEELKSLKVDGGVLGKNMIFLYNLRFKSCNSFKLQLW